MKVIVHYECDVCGATYDKAEDALACQATPVERLGLAPGEIVTAGQAYGWWKDGNGATTRDNPDQSWFHVERGDPEARSHLVRAQLGFPKFVVLAVAPYSQVAARSGPWAHKEVALIYSPGWANGPETLYAWAPSVKHRLGMVTPEELAAYQAAVQGQRPTYLS
jgi:hypothetical protein